MAAAVGEPRRLNILRLLARGEHTVTNVATVLRVEHLNVSHHLKILKRAGLVSSKRDGRFAFYGLIGAAVTGGTLELSHPSGLKGTLPLL